MACFPFNFPIIIRKGITFGPLKIIAKDVLLVPVNLTGWSVFALARPNVESPNTLDLTPVITNAAAGEITIQFTDEQTVTFNVGEYVYDLVLENPGGERLGPFLAGKLTILNTVSRT